MKGFRDRPLAPLETAIYWIQYVIRHNGARHLRSAAVDLEWYQYTLLDVISVIFLSFAVVIAAFYLIIKKLLSLCCRSKPKEKKDKGKTKKA